MKQRLPLLTYALVGTIGAVALIGCGGVNPVDNGGSGGGTPGSKKMPDGKTWTTENLNIKTGNSWCYDGSAPNCNKYGRLYDWATAKAACPSGWHLPSKQEWDALLIAVGGAAVADNKLKSKTGWNKNGNGTDNFGFSALPGGYRYSDGSFRNAGVYGIWWTATEHGGGGAYNMLIDSNAEGVYVYSLSKGDGLSVRCVGN